MLLHGLYEIYHWREFHNRWEESGKEHILGLIFYGYFSYLYLCYNRYDFNKFLLCVGILKHREEIFERFFKFFSKKFLRF